MTIVNDITRKKNLIIDMFRMFDRLEEQFTTGIVFSSDWKFLETAECELKETVIDAVYLSSRIAPLLVWSSTRTSYVRLWKKSLE